MERYIFKTDVPKSNVFSGVKLPEKREDSIKIRVKLKF